MLLASALWTNEDEMITFVLQCSDCLSNPLSSKSSESPRPNTNIRNLLPSREDLFKWHNSVKIPGVRLKTNFSDGLRWAEYTSNNLGPTDTTTSAILHSLTSTEYLASPLEIAPEYVLNMASSSGAVCTTWTHLRLWLSQIICACFPSFTPWPMTTSMFMSFRGNVKQSIGSNPGRCCASNIITLWLRAILLSSSLQLGTRKLTATFGCLAKYMANAIFIVERRPWEEPHSFAKRRTLSFSQTRDLEDISVTQNDNFSVSAATVWNCSFQLTSRLPCPHCAPPNPKSYLVYVEWRLKT